MIANKNIALPDTALPKPMPTLHRIFRCCMLLTTLSAAIVGGCVIWQATTFFHAELIHQNQMAYGDKGQPMLVRLGSFTAWLPFVAFSITAIWINIHLAVKWSGPCRVAR